MRVRFSPSMDILLLLTSFLVVHVLCRWGQDEFLGNWVSGGVGVSIGEVVHWVRVLKKSVTETP